MTVSQKVTKKRISAEFDYRIEVGYGNLQRLLNAADIYGHTERAEGWGADVYRINWDTCIVTGYAPFGNVSAPYELCQKYERMASKVWSDYHKNFNYGETKDKLYLLAEMFCKEAIELKGGKKA